MPVISGRRNRLSALRWLASVAVGLGATGLLVRACAQGPLDQSAARLESGDRNAPAGTGSSETAKQAVVEREASTMKRLHQLGESDRATVLGLALAGNLQLPGGADAPERGWVICRSLVELERFPEAVAVARVLVQQYPNTPWALDVERHLLVNPMSDLSERGYGHQFELE
jgi:hypothetical protein